MPKIMKLIVIILPSKIIRYLPSVNFFKWESLIGPNHWSELAKYYEQVWRHLKVHIFAGSHAHACCTGYIMNNLFSMNTRKLNVFFFRVFMV